MIIEFFLWDIQVHVRLLKILGDCFFNPPYNYFPPMA
jgi:hypothetical protein